jgi:hypothetical protein
MLVSVQDLVTYMDISLSMRQKDAAEMVLEGLQSELEAYLRRPVGDSFSTTSPVENTIYTEPPQTIYMRNSPIVSVIEVRVKPQFGQERVLVEESDYVVRRYGIDYFFGFSNDVVTVNYTAGLDGENIKMFKLMILRAATREMQNMHDDVVGVKDLNTRNVAPLETGFSDRELASVRKYRRVRVA